MGFRVILTCQQLFAFTFYLKISIIVKWFKNYVCKLFSWDNSDVSVIWLKRIADGLLRIFYALKNNKINLCCTYVIKNISGTDSKFTKNHNLFVSFDSSCSRKLLLRTKQKLSRTQTAQNITIKLLSVLIANRGLLSEFSKGKE